MTDTGKNMVLAKRVGTILKEAREGKKLSVRDVSRDTNITPRFIDALENEDYTQFPGETYALGFLRSYAEYLNLDTEHLLNLYRGLQIDQSQAPLKELTKPTGPFTIPVPDLDRNTLIALGGGAVILALIVLFATGVIHLPSFSSSRSSSAAEAMCAGRELLPVNLPQQGTPPRVENLSLENSLKFSTDAVSIKLCLLEITKEGGRSLAQMALRINDESDYRFQASQGETVYLGPDIKELESLTRQIKITPEVLGDVSARIQLDSGPAAQPANPENKPAAVTGTGDIQVTLEFVGESFLQWVTDGETHRGDMVPAGESRTLEAKNRLEIKVGNAGAVRILREGQPPRIAGPPLKVAKIVYKKAPDPLDPGIFRIQESIEVAQ